MDPSGYWKIAILVLCLFLSALYSASETALMALSQMRVKQMIDNNVKGVKKVEKLLSEPNKLLSSILIGNNLVNIGASSIMTSLAIEIYGNTGVGIATGIMTLLILVFAEITPKSLAVQNAERYAVRLSNFVRLNMVLVTPISYLLTKTTNYMIKKLGGDVDKNQPLITHEQLKTIVSVSHTEGVLEGEEKDMINNVFDFRNSHVNDVMIPRADMVALDVNLPYHELIALMSDKQFSRIPVYENKIDNIIGILFIKDLIFFQSYKEEKIDLKKYIRPPHFTYSYKPIKDLFKEMKTNRIHMVIVADEYGGTEGMVTMEDLIEEIVGDIEDEYDKISTDIEIIRENEYIVSGNTKLEVINELLDLEIESDDFDTIAGFIMGTIDRIPQLYEKIEFENIKFFIEETNKNRIEKIRIIKTNQEVIQDI